MGEDEQSKSNDNLLSDETEVPTEAFFSDNINDENNVDVNIIEENVGGDDEEIDNDETEVPTEVSFNPDISISIPDDNDIDLDIIDDNDGGDDDFDENNFIDEDEPDDEIAVVGSTCFNPQCTDFILDNDADGFSCGDRIQYLMDFQGRTEFDACQQVAVNEFSVECGLCQPTL